ncbi:hypothetical protein BLA29_008422 [Euroglyphus maynei]|uniref:Uncharacterized protein n=1 Tax=Euroglyphus maynei TaxID=6958 RepID=A0A1Y3B3W5_EURMA|nr:hypothetical protein BLA29_008422 [Euroglyphus maynei]
MEEMNENLEDQLIDRHDGRPLSIDMPSLISMEILESHGHGRQMATKSKPEQNVDQVLQNVNEMNRILNDTEKYLDRMVNEKSMWLAYSKYITYFHDFH